MGPSPSLPGPRHRPPVSVPTPDAPGPRRASTEARGSILGAGLGRGGALPEHGSGSPDMGPWGAWALRESGRALRRPHARGSSGPHGRPSASAPACAV